MCCCCCCVRDCDTPLGGKRTLSKHHCLVVAPLPRLILKPLSIDWSVAGAKIPAVTFIAQAGLPAHELAHMLDSLAR